MLEIRTDNQYIVKGGRMDSLPFPQAPDYPGKIAAIVKSLERAEPGSNNFKRLQRKLATLERKQEDFAFTNGRRLANLVIEIYGPQNRFVFTKEVETLDSKTKEKVYSCFKRALIQKSKAIRRAEEEDVQHG